MLKTLIKAGIIAVIISLVIHTGCSKILPYEGNRRGYQNEKQMTYEEHEEQRTDFANSLHKNYGMYDEEKIKYQAMLQLLRNDARKAGSDSEQAYLLEKLEILDIIKDSTEVDFIFRQAFSRYDRYGMGAENGFIKEGIQKRVDCIIGTGSYHPGLNDREIFDRKGDDIIKWGCEEYDATDFSTVKIAYLQGQTIFYGRDRTTGFTDIPANISATEAVSAGIKFDGKEIYIKTLRKGEAETNIFRLENEDIVVVPTADTLENIFIQPYIIPIPNPNNKTGHYADRDWYYNMAIAGIFGDYKELFKEDSLDYSIISVITNVETLDTLACDTVKFAVNGKKQGSFYQPIYSSFFHNRNPKNEEGNSIYKVAFSVINNHNGNFAVGKKQVVLPNSTDQIPEWEVMIVSKDWINNPSTYIPDAQPGSSMKKGDTAYIMIPLTEIPEINGRRSIEYSVIIHKADKKSFEGIARITRIYYNENELPELDSLIGGSTQMNTIAEGITELQHANQYFVLPIQIPKGKNDGLYILDFFGGIVNPKTGEYNLKVMGRKIINVF